MAKLLEAIAQGSYKAAADPTKRSVRQALDPQIMSTLYQTPVFGTLVRSIVSEFKKDETKKDVKSTTDLSKNFQSLTLQLSSIADIMEDIRDLNLRQLNLNKNVFLRDVRISRRQQLEDIESRREVIRPFTSSLISKPADDKTGASNLGSLFKGSELLLGLLGLGAFALLGSGNVSQYLRKKADEGVESLKGTIGKGIESAFESIGISINESFKNIFSTAAISGIAIGALSLLIPKPLRGLLFGKGGALTALGVGAGAGAGYAISGEMAGEGSSGSSLGALAGAAGTLGTLGLLRKLTSTQKIEPPKVERPAITPIEDATGRKVPKYTTIQQVESERVANRQVERTAERGGIKKTIERIKVLGRKYGAKRVTFAIMARLGVPIAGLVGLGPLGMVLAVLSAGYTIYELSNILKDIEEAAAKDASVDNVQDIQTPDYSDPLTSMQGTPLPPVPVKPPVSTLNAQMEEYERQVIAAESGGQNIRTQIDPTGKATAFGYYQITKPTFEGLKKKFEDLQGFTYEQFQNSKEIQQKFFQALTKDNAAALQNAGLEVDKKNLYLLHRFGADEGIRILKAFKEDPNKPLRDIVRRSVIEQNPQLANSTVGGAVLGSYAKMDSNIQVGDTKTDVAALSPTEGMGKYIGLIEELSMAKQIFSAMKPTVVIDQSQNVSQAGGGAGENRRGNPPTTLPYIQDHDKMLAMLTPFGFTRLT